MPVDAIVALKHVVDETKERGDWSTCSVFATSAYFSAHSCVSGLSDTSTSNISRLKESLSNIIGVCDILGRLLRVAQSTEIELRQRLREKTFQVQFSQLPDDILSMIFELACSPGTEVVKVPPTPLSLSCVSRRFRRLTLQLPNLWTNISACDLNLEQAKLFVERSKSQMLEVFASSVQQAVGYNGEIPGLRVNSMVNKFEITVASISARLVKLTIEASVDGFSAEVYERHPLLSFPHLEELNVTYENSVSSVPNGRPDTQLYRKWDMPKLNKFSAFNHTPEFDTDVPSHLLSVELSLGSLGRLYGWNIRGVTRLIQSLTSLETLNFEMNHELFSDRDMLSSRIILPHLRNLSLTFGVDGLVSITNFFSFFEFKNVRSLKFDVVFQMETRPGWAFSYLLSKCWGTPNVTDLSIAINYKGNTDLQTSHEEMLMQVSASPRIQNLERLTLEYPYGREGDNPFLDFAGKVRKVRVENCKGNIGSVLEVLAKKTNSFAGNSEDGTCLLIDEPGWCLE